MSHDFTADLSQILNDYERDLNEQVIKDITKAGQDAAKYTRENSPKDSGNYAQGWRYATDDSAEGFTATVYNAGKHKSLTHLLEHGHEQFYMGQDLGYRQPGKPHIEPAYERAKSELLGRMHG